MDFMCDWKNSMESRMTPRLWTSVDGEIVQPRSPTFWRSALEATTMSSVLLVFSLSRFDVIQRVAGWTVWCRDIIEYHQHKNGS